MNEESIVEGSIVEESTVLDIALKMGFNPDFEGENKKSPEEYILTEREIGKTKSKTIDRLENRLSDLGAKLDNFTAKYTKSQIDAAKSKLETEKDEAIEEGDKAKVKQIDNRINELDTDTPDARVKAFEDAEQAFGKDHDWWNDELNQAEALVIATNLMQKDPNRTPEDLFKKMEEYGRKKHPDSYQNPNRSKAANVSGETHKRKATSKWEELKQAEPAAESTFQMFVDDGIYEDTPEVREKYAKAVLRETAE